MKHYLLAGALLFILASQLIGSTLNESPVFDELAFAPAGYEFLTKHDFRFEPFSPPLTREIIALPMLLDKTVMQDPVFFWPRFMVIIFAVILAVIVYLFASRLYGKNAGLFALFLYVFNPEILARGHYAMTDFITTFFIVLSVFLFLAWKKNFSYTKITLFGIVVGCALASKFTSLPYLLITFVSIVFLEYKAKVFKKVFWRKKIGRLFFLMGVTFVAVWATYFFTWEPALGYRFDTNRLAVQLAKTNQLVKFGLEVPIPLGSYLSTIKINLRHNYTNDFVKEAVFWGNYSKFSFPGFAIIPIFLIKTPIPFLVFSLAGLFIWYQSLGRGTDGKKLTKKTGSLFYKLAHIKEKNIEKTLPVILILVVFITMLMSHVLLVIRYILPVYPFLAILSSQVVLVNSRKLKFAIFLLSAWYAVGTVSASPHYISYVNEFIGGSDNAYKYVAEGNLDLGQGLIALSKYQRENKIDNLQLAYFGVANPQDYGIRYERIYDRSIADDKKIVPLKLKGNIIAISATCWYFCEYYKNPEIKRLKPVDFVGGSILIFNK